MHWSPLERKVKTGSPIPLSPSGVSIHSIGEPRFKTFSRSSSKRFDDLRANVILVHILVKGKNLAGPAHLRPISYNVIILLYLNARHSETEHMQTKTLTLFLISRIKVATSGSGRSSMFSFACWRLPRWSD